MDSKKTGLYVGAGIIAASGVATAVALARGGKGGPNPLLTGIIPRYATQPGDPYNVYFLEEDGTDTLASIYPSIWFENVWDYHKYIYDNLRQRGLPVYGALVGVGHSAKAGVHAIGKRAPMRGFNNFGVKASKKYIESGGFYWVAGSDEYDEETGTWQSDPSMRWRFYASIEKAMKHWLQVIRENYPTAYEELFARDPDVDKYVYGLKHGIDGQPYATGAQDMADVIDWAMENVPQMLHEHFGYNI